MEGTIETKGLTKQDVNILKGFKELISYTGADKLRKDLTKMLILHTRLLAYTSENDIARDRDGTEAGIYFMGEIISLLDPDA